MTPAAKTSTKSSARASADSMTGRQQQDVAQYVADMLLELRNMAKSANHPKVMVPLEFAYYEAFSAANRVEIPPAELERLNRLSQVAAGLEAQHQEPVT